MGEHFVLDDGCVLGDEDIFDGEGGDFGEEDAAECVGDRGIDANEGEGEVEVEVLVFYVGSQRIPWRCAVELDLEVLEENLDSSLETVVPRINTFLKYSRSHSWFSPGQ